MCLHFSDEKQEEEEEADAACLIETDDREQSARSCIYFVNGLSERHAQATNPVHIACLQPHTHTNTLDTHKQKCEKQKVNEIHHLEIE